MVLAKLVRRLIQISALGLRDHRASFRSARGQRSRHVPLIPGHGGCEREGKTYIGLSEITHFSTSGLCPQLVVYRKCPIPPVGQIALWLCWTILPDHAIYQLLPSHSSQDPSDIGKR
jgi:hypothetical protein